jgi:SpoVK/Ycf46/Vps4 family AAA+-type ATPase
MTLMLSTLLRCVLYFMFDRRFDRELLFPLPDLAARRTILGIHSRAWSPQPAPALLDELARLTGGYCGADIKV